VHGHVSNVRDYLADADILLFPSYGEGMSNALIESLHYALVCICFSNTVFPEFVEMGFHLILANDRDQHDLSEKLLFAVEKLSSEKIKAEKNVMLALHYFDPERERDEWKKLLV
jgi:glycosyltransferase involved in cell wall biosynthesis